MALLVAPAEEGVYDRQRMPTAVVELGLTLEVPFPDLVFDPIEFADQGQGLGCSWIAVTGALEVAPGYAPSIGPE